MESMQYSWRKLADKVTYGRRGFGNDTETYSSTFYVGANNQTRLILQYFIINLNHNVTFTIKSSFKIIHPPEWHPRSGAIIMQDHQCLYVKSMYRIARLH